MILNHLWEAYPQIEEQNRWLTQLFNTQKSRLVYFTLLNYLLEQRNGLHDLMTVERVNLEEDNWDMNHLPNHLDGLVDEEEDYSKE